LRFRAHDARLRFAAKHAQKKNGPPRRCLATSAPWHKGQRAVPSSSSVCRTLIVSRVVGTAAEWLEPVDTSNVEW
jgi:hypothetical protein